jgi:hypothetical protein
MVLRLNIAVAGQAMISGHEADGLALHTVIHPSLQRERTNWEPLPVHTPRSLGSRSGVCVDGRRCTCRAPKTPSFLMHLTAPFDN